MAPLKILYVEDNQDHAELVKRSFENYKIPSQVYHVSDGEEALDYLFHRGKYSEVRRSPRPDIVLLDLRLPKIDGLEVLKTIRTSEELKKLPVVIFSTSERERDMLAAFRYQANCYLVKPVDFMKFDQMIHVIRFYSMGNKAENDG